MGASCLSLTAILGVAVSTGLLGGSAPRSAEVMPIMGATIGAEGARESAGPAPSGAGEVKSEEVRAWGEPAPIGVKERKGSSGEARALGGPAPLSAGGGGKGSSEDARASGGPAFGNGGGGKGGSKDVRAPEGPAPGSVGGSKGGSKDVPDSGRSAPGNVEGGKRDSGGPALGGGGKGGPEGCGRLLINEVKVSGLTSALDEFVELFNAGTCPVSLDGWSIRYLSAKGLGGFHYWDPPPSGRSVAPGKFFVIASKGYTGAIKDDDAKTARGLAELGALALCFRDRRVDSVVWGEVPPEHAYAEGVAAGAVPRGQSLLRRVDGGDSNRNEVDFWAGVPTPGRSNRGP